MNIVLLPQRCLLTAAQLRAARAMLRMDQAALASAAGISVETVKRLEKMEGNLSAVRVDTLDAITAVLEKEGIAFVDSDNGGPGVRLNPKPRARRK